VPQLLADSAAELGNVTASQLAGAAADQIAQAALGLDVPGRSPAYFSLR